MDDLKQQLKRSGVKFEIGGFKPSDDPSESWFGRVNLCGQGETWPEFAGKPMHALCQINVRNLQVRPHRLDDIDFIAVFVGADALPIDARNGESWCLRAYKNGDALVPLAQRDTNSSIKAFPMRSKVFHDDYPCWDDVPIELPEDVADSYFDLFKNMDCLKLGGWPTLIQSEIFWAPWNKHPASPEFVFQIGSSEKGNWMWGDNGVGYFGRGTATGTEDEWALAWQCY